MKYYKDTAGNIYAVSPIQQPQDGWVKLTKEETEAHLNPAPTTEQLAEQADKDRTAAMLQGIEFQGVMCSATKEDMWGLSSVAPWIESGNSTAFEFDNGNVLVLTPENYLAFYDVWAAFRASFFLG